MKKFSFALFVCLVSSLSMQNISAAVISKYEEPYVYEKDLAGVWEISLDSSNAWRNVNVPAGGWSSFQQEPRIKKEIEVKDHVTYRKTLELPGYKKGQQVRILFGAVNFGAEVAIDGQKVKKVENPQTRIYVDITDYVKPNSKHELEVKTYMPEHYHVPQGKPAHEKTVPGGFYYQLRYGNLDNFALGITKYVKLVITEPVRISDWHIVPSVKNNSFDLDVWVENTSDSAKKVKLDFELTSWNNSAFKYPKLPSKQIRIPANTNTIVSFENVKWLEGPESYWWPNIPFDQEYRAQLNILSIRFIADGQDSQIWSNRFGFVEYTEGPYYYEVNGVRVTGFGDGTSESHFNVYDAYSSPTFTTDAYETYFRHFKVGLNTFRTHQSIPAKYMLDVADEVGFMIIPETPIRGGNNGWSDNMPKIVKEMVNLCRNNASVCRYSAANEVSSHAEPWSTLIDEIMEEDDSRPIAYDDFSFDEPRVIHGRSGGRAMTAIHYAGYRKRDDIITSIGEYAPIYEMPDIARRMRYNDVAYFAPWCWMNYWPNLLQGMHQKNAGWPTRADRVDGVDGWNSPEIDFLQKSYHPFLLMDYEIHMLNRFTTNWPADSITMNPKKEYTREIELFNSVLTDGEFVLDWKIRLGGLDGKVIAEGKSKPKTIKAAQNLKQSSNFE